MITDDKTIYFVMSDLDAPVLPAIPQTDSAKKSLLHAFVVLFKDFLPDAGKNITEEVVKYYSSEKLKELAGSIEQETESGVRDTSAAREVSLTPFLGNVVYQGLKRILCTRIEISLMLALLLAGCKYGAAPSSTSSKYEPVPPPLIRMNPHPVDKYRARVDVEGAVDPLQVTAEVDYMMVNSSHCVPIDPRRSLGGSRPTFGKSVSVPLSSVSTGRYEIVYYQDLLLDEDYYGKGVCKWAAYPDITIYYAGVRYMVVNNTKSIVGTGRKICQPALPGTMTGCGDVAYQSRQFDGAFHVTLTTNKE